MMKIGICGISGRMGRVILTEILKRGHKLGAAFESVSSPYYGKNAVEINSSCEKDIIVTAIDEEIISGSNVVIDFSAPEATMKLITVAPGANVPVVIGTTGLAEKEVSNIHKAAERIPIVYAPNMSVGVNLLFKLVELSAKALQQDFDIEVFEAHHRNKKDAPSGTAKHLLDIIKKNIPRLENAPLSFDRSKILASRSDDEIGVMVLRGGDIVGEHTVYFSAVGERLELTHRASNRDVFSLGAVRAAEFVVDQRPGLYSMFDVLGL